MTRIIDWIKINKLSSLLILILLFLLFQNGFQNLLGFSSFNRSQMISPGYEMGLSVPSSASLNLALPKIGSAIAPREYPQAPPTQTKDRLVVQNSYLSLLVKNVSQTLKSINNYVSSIDGYMVNTNLSNPEEAASATITLRLPTKKLDEALEHFRTLAVKVTSENLEGYDVTDQFVDNEAKLSVLNSNLARFKEIMSQAKEISDILRIQQEIFNLQSQIDGIKGQNNYLEQTAKLAKVTLYLSTDEFSLPYAPSESWRPEVIFKTAVRSLVGNIRNVASLAIWLVVYSVVWIPALLLILFLRKRKIQPKSST